MSEGKYSAKVQRQLPEQFKHWFYRGYELIYLKYY